MEPPSKRLRLDPSRYNGDDDDEENQDELSMTPAQFDAMQDPMYQLDKGRAKAATRLKSTFEDIFAKYGKDFGDDDGDLINFYTDEIEVDNGHLESLEREDNATEDSASSDEEGVALNGKPSGRGETSRLKSKSKSLTPANRAKLTQTPRFTSSWDGPPGLGPYRLSSPFFSSSPYGAYPPFDFGGSPFGNAHIDPVWQTPDLPIQRPNYQHSQLTGIGGDLFGSLGGRSQQVPKRLVSAKSFLLRTASASGIHDDDAEEDDVLLGKDAPAKGQYFQSEGHDTPPMPASLRFGSYQSSQGSGQQQPFYGIGLSEDGLQNTPNSERKEVAQTKTAKLATLRTTSTLHQPMDESNQHRQIGANRHKTSPTCPKRGRPKKSDTKKPARALDEQPKSEPRQLRPNERRIEIIFPMMKRLFLTETEDAADRQAPVIDESSHELEMEREQTVDENIEIASTDGSLHTSQLIGTNEDAVSNQPSADLAESSEAAKIQHAVQSSLNVRNTPELSNPQDSQSPQTHEPIDLSITDTRLSNEQCLKHACIEASQESGSSQTVASDVIAGTYTINIQATEQDSNCSDEDTIAPSEQPSPVLNAHMDEEQAAHNPDLEEDTEELLVDQNSLKEVSVQLLPSAQILREHSADNTTEKPILATTEVISVETAISPDLESSHYENEDTPQHWPDFSPAQSLRQEILSTHRHTLVTTTPRHSVELDDGFGSSPNKHGTRGFPPEQRAGSRCPEHHRPTVHQTPEPELCADPDYAIPTFEGSGIAEDPEHNAPNQPSLTSILVNEIDGLQLNSDYWDIPRSPSLGILELPDEDLSVLPNRPSAHSASKLVLRLPANITETDAQHNADTGRSPSPELGTPTGPEKARRAPSGAKAPLTPTTPTRKRGPRTVKPRSSHHRSPSSKRFPLSSLIPEDIDDESEDELSLADPFSSSTSRLHSPFSRASTNASPSLPPLLTSPRKRNRKNGLLVSSPASKQTPNRILGLRQSRNMPPATDSRTTRGQTRRGQNRAVHSSPLARRVAERLLSSPTKRHRATPTMSPSLVASPNGTLRRCGEDGFVCERAFCLTCCI
ncbi:hypothetical protein F5Y10DRAFT_230502 [Nemania abortiva]|nr:hypothetical protein F5Y10DRAFT_230502 [Nemania abortiva]